MTRTLITGATGGLGRNAVQLLLGKGETVRASGRNLQVGKALAAQGAEFIALDLAKATPEQLAGLVHETDTIWHCAALSSPWGAEADFIAANFTATERLLQAAGIGGVRRFVHISTPAIYFDYTNRLEIKENFRPALYVNAYARTKAQAEGSVQQAVLKFPHMHCTILRPRAIFGPHDQVMMPRLSRVLAGRGGTLPLPRGGKVMLDLTYVENVVHAMWLASSNVLLPSGAAFNITNQQPILLDAILHKLFVDALQRPLKITTVPYPMLALVARGMQALAHLTGKEPALTVYSVGALGFDMTLDNTRAQQLLGYFPPISLDEGIQRTADWMKCHG